jgi:hypothetical protein
MVGTVPLPVPLTPPLTGPVTNTLQPELRGPDVTVLSVSSEKILYL